uniref:Serine-threonine/tyrosine-protein kinase catalytic domain-containing protein n=1 Tax=Brassica oleracea TaxID=3712 RepID=A0A3P6DTQ4_BRAOL|nr:unnamed protein product [Brassica oleracea]
MTDAGNFRLLSKDSSKDLWSSFDNPTDSLLPLRGAYGIVYKGVLKVVGDSQVTVAVKKLDRVVQEGEKEFRNEVKAIGQTYHKNLVRLHWLLQRRAESFDCLQLLTSSDACQFPFQASKT